MSSTTIYTPQATSSSPYLSVIVEEPELMTSTSFLAIAAATVVLGDSRWFDNRPTAGGKRLGYRCTQSTLWESILGRLSDDCDNDGQPSGSCGQRGLSNGSPSRLSNQISDG